MDRRKIDHILFIFDSRATFSYSNNVIQKIKKNKKIKYSTLITGNYLDKKLGVGLNVFKKNKIQVTNKAKFLSSTSRKNSWPINLGRAIVEYSKQISKIKPDLIMITGDRIETLAACLTATYLNIPIAHIQAGDKSGHVDDIARAAIAKMAHIHFASCEDSVKRLKKWGEPSKRIFHVGAPQLDDISALLNKKRKPNKKKNIIIIFHPVLDEISQYKQNIKNLFKSILKFDYNYQWIYPNNDFGYKVLIKFFNSSHVRKKVQIIKNLERDEFLKLMLNSDAMIGNSSSGIIEAPSLKLPVINIGNRQHLRPQAKNIVNTSYNQNDIVKKIQFIFNNKNFLKKNKTTKNLYYKKNSAEQILKILKNLKKKDNLFKKI
ncbi:UDP-N-acetylglucosamine 2-epimerase [Pelagibacteraceae bacterium]|nr:UDP-N-acetylglucosamine 2-epimerase [Pelagibacteraceae bacterium]